VAFEGKLNKSSRNQWFYHWVLWERDSCNSCVLCFNKDFSPPRGCRPSFGRITLNLVFLFVVICFIAYYGTSLPCFRCRSQCFLLFFHNNWYQSDG